MSRIGNKAITIPETVELTIGSGNEVTVKGPKGELSRKFSELVELSVEEGILTVKRLNEKKHTKQLHGTTRALLANMIEGVTNGFTRELQLVGIGYKAILNGTTLTLNIGYSHPIIFEVEDGLVVTVAKPTEIKVEGIDKQRVGELAAVIRATRKPEPYLGKGIRYKDEIVRRKEGKTAAKA
jgi:large subunit ribosomal protein L6